MYNAYLLKAWQYSSQSTFIVCKRNSWHILQKINLVWDNMRTSKWDQNCNFCLNYPCSTGLVGVWMCFAIRSDTRGRCWERERARLPSDFIVMDMDLWFYGPGSERNSQRERDEEKETKRIERGFKKKNSHVRRMCLIAVFSMEQSCCETWLVFGYGRSRWQRKATVLIRCQTPDTSVGLAFVSVRGGK